VVNEVDRIHFKLRQKMKYSPVCNVVLTQKRKIVTASTTNQLLVK